MRTSKKDLKAALRAGERILGGYAQSASPEIVEIVADIGYDFVILSSEDTVYDVRDRCEQVYVADAAGLATIFRPPTNEPTSIRRALDIGMDGLNVPMVNTADDARRVVDAALYPPIGHRGLNAMSRPVHFGRDFGPEYFATANDSTLITVLIESKEAVDNIEEILSVEGIDVAYLGPTDLSISLGIPGQVFDERVERCAARVREAAAAAGVAVANVVYNPLDRDELDRRVEEGYQMLSAFLDVQLFRQACERIHDDVRLSLSAT
jgi:2-keto-3-deoxy-L-rhamnonate aldolase RhmA